MKYTIEGFNQAIAVEYGLDVNDLVILRWIVDFYNTDKMTKTLVKDKIYFWVNYKAIIEDLPILGIKTKDNIYRRLQKMVKCDVLEHITIKQGGTFSYFRMGNNYQNLLTELNNNPPTFESEGATQKSEGCYSKVGTNNPNTNNPNTIINSKSKDLEGQAPKKIKSEIMKEVFSDSTNDFMKDALRKWINYCKDTGIQYRGATFLKWVDFLRDNSKGNSHIAMSLVNQSINNSWRALYPLKGYKGKQLQDSRKQVRHEFDTDTAELADTVY